MNFESYGSPGHLHNIACFPLQDGLEEYAYLIWSVTDVFFAVFIYLCIPETRGKTPEQIQAEIHSKKKMANGNGTMQPLQPI